jgi:hypothetical protein
MISFSADPNAAEQEMRAVIYYLTAFGFVDGTFDVAEMGFVLRFVRELVEARARDAQGITEAVRAELVDRWSRHFEEVAEEVAREIDAHTKEPVAEGEADGAFVMTRVKLRCFELFTRFDEESRARLLAIAEQMIAADGVVHPEELRFRDELHALLDAPQQLDDVEVEVTLEEVSARVNIHAPVRRPILHDGHEFLTLGEWDYPSDPEGFAREADRDVHLAERLIKRLDAARARGAGRLQGARDFRDFSTGEGFLDGHVHVLPAPAGGEMELLVIGDLHGCYSCLKGALLQTDFFGKVERHVQDPSRHPPMKLVLLGDYIDRGRFSYNGVMRAAMQLALVAPEHVYVLRGNHEYYVELNNKVLAPVRPAEAMVSIQQLAPKEVLATWMRLFESLPHALAFDQFLFVHAGLPREKTLREKWSGLHSLNDPDVRFQMLWSDPSEADHVPDDLQEASARFPFGRKQFQSFMHRLGVTTMVRGHERVVQGFKVVYDDDDARLLSLFSAGGATNADLPATSNYREVTPMALTIKWKDGMSEVTPFPIEYERFNDPRYNRFFASHLTP